jgi:hypothetical protein
MMILEDDFFKEKIITFFFVYLKEQLGNLCGIVNVLE